MFVITSMKNFCTGILMCSLYLKRKCCINCFYAMQTCWFTCTSTTVCDHTFYVHSSYGTLDFYTISGTLWTSKRPVARHNTAQTPNIHALSGIRTRDHSVPASEDSSCDRDRHISLHQILFCGPCTSLIKHCKSCGEGMYKSMFSWLRH
jgi:hypothetical protein